MRAGPKRCLCLQRFIFDRVNAGSIEMFQKLSLLILQCGLVRTKLFQEMQNRDWSLALIVAQFERHCADLTDPGDSRVHRLFDSQLDRIGLFVGRLLVGICSRFDDQSNPVSESNPGLTKRARQITELKMTMGVDQTGNDRAIAKVDNPLARALIVRNRADVGDPVVAVYFYKTVLDRRAINRANPARSINLGRFSRIRIQGLIGQAFDFSGNIRAMKRESLPRSVLTTGWVSKRRNQTINKTPTTAIRIPGMIAYW